MREFWLHNTTIPEKNWELKNSLAELECEEAIIDDKKEFGRVRNSMMKVLRVKYGFDVTNRVLSRVNKRIQKNYLKIEKSLIN